MYTPTTKPSPYLLHGPERPARRCRFLQRRKVMGAGTASSFVSCGKECRPGYLECDFHLRLYERKLARYLARLKLAKVPYPEHCRHPEKCAGKSYCQREISCID